MVADIRLPMLKQWVSFVAFTPRKALIQNYCPFKQQAWISDLQKWQKPSSRGIVAKVSNKGFHLD